MMSSFSVKFVVLLVIACMLTATAVAVAGDDRGPVVRVDPVNDLVIVMTRNTAGKNFEKYHPQFLQAIVDGMATGAASPAG
jgi:hypothetical protein